MRSPYYDYPSQQAARYWADQERLVERLLRLEQSVREFERKQYRARLDYYRRLENLR